jgi:site-specific recombinase XerD
MARERTLTELRTRGPLNEALQRVSGGRLRVFTVKQWLGQFVEGKRKSRSERTVFRHENVANRFVRFLGKRAAASIAAVTSKDISDFRDRREAIGLAASTVNLEIEMLSAAFNAARKQNYVTVNPCTVIEPLRHASMHKSVFTLDEVSALIEAATDDWKGAILVAFYTGADLRDCANLRWKNIELTGRAKKITFAQSKTGRQVTMTLQRVLQNYLLSLPAPKSGDTPLFPSLAYRTASALSKQFRRIMRLANIEASVLRRRCKSGRAIHAHSFGSLRHSFSLMQAHRAVSKKLQRALTGAAASAR